MAMAHPPLTEAILMGGAQESDRVTQASVVDQAASAVATIEVPTIWRTLGHKKIAGGKRHAQGWCLCGGCK